MGHRREAVPDKLSSSPIEAIDTPGREGKRQIAIDADGDLPQTAAMAAKAPKCAGQCHAPQAQGHRRAAQRLNQTGAGVQAVQRATAQSVCSARSEANSAFQVHQATTINPVAPGS
jgi:hypothetical protein